MRFKLDENMDVRAASVLAEAGHDVATVAGQGLGGAVDAVVAVVVRSEDRILVTLDRGFGDLRTYPPGSHPGIVVLRLRRQARTSVNTPRCARSHLAGQADAPAIDQVQPRCVPAAAEVLRVGPGVDAADRHDETDAVAWRTMSANSSRTTSRFRVGQLRLLGGPVSSAGVGGGETRSDQREAEASLLQQMRGPAAAAAVRGE